MYIFSNSATQQLSCASGIPAVKTNRYGDEALTRLRGIISFGVEVITRVHQWTISQREIYKEYQAESTDRFPVECYQ
ncbi:MULTISPECIES: hypothetical protein [Shewanella]|uniref:hypothetical protein n=1 Tax=Shewanella TaxID=22 RepID=UPI000C34A6BD|nr:MULTISPECIES: hypothetical protein [Shewanella]MCA0950173.1 hypothetical protein [Shewanella chilikensis]MCL1152573.1 hypothetical protein [Shewanella chilikensis]GGZ49100.1 hypothetical protein GCM10007105_38430 [Shewanella chilikensis]HCD14123.1 hypothetical protein [Shewanella sp.]